MGQPGFIQFIQNPVERAVRKGGKDQRWSCGCKVALLSGSFENFTGTIVEIDEENQKLKVSVPLFGRDTVVDVDYESARKVMDEDE